MNHTNNPMLSAAKAYTDAGYWVHWLEGPVYGNPKSGKNPIEKHWQKKPRYTYDELAAAYESGFNIGIRPGPWSSELNLIAIDGDLPDPEKQVEFDDYLKALVGDTPITEYTANGKHYHFLVPKHLIPGAGNRKVLHKRGKGIPGGKTYDWQIELFYGIASNLCVAPSVHACGFVYEKGPGWCQPLPAPETVLRALETLKGPSAKEVKVGGPKNGHETTRIKTALAHLVSTEDLRRQFCDDYDNWLHIGMALHSYDPDLFQVWNEWSKNSDAYDESVAEAKWESFRANKGTNRITLGSLFKMAIDSGCKLPQPAAGRIPLDDYCAAIKGAWGDRLKYNELTDSVELDGKARANKEDELTIGMDRLGFNGDTRIERAIVDVAMGNRCHPIRDAFTTCVWDGKDHFAKFFEFVRFADPEYSNVFFKKWCGNLVAKVFEYERNSMLVLEGKQRMGKSSIARWLGSVVSPEYYDETPLKASNKDHFIKMAHVLLWELPEFGGIVRKNDWDQLKSAISLSFTNERKSYGRDSISRRCIASFIATVNPKTKATNAQYLNDPTGYSRFLPIVIKSIDFRYSKEIDVRQLWAQAYQVYKTGAYQLTPEEEAVALDRCMKREIPSDLEDFVCTWYEVTEDRKKSLSYREILADLKDAGLMNLARGLRDAFLKYGAVHYRNNGIFYMVQRRKTNAEGVI